MVLAGHDAGPVAEAFARAHGLPLLAEPSSNARFGPNAVGPYRLMLDNFGPGSALPIERVVVFGRPTLSRPVAALLAATTSPPPCTSPFRWPGMNMAGVARNASIPWLNWQGSPAAALMIGSTPGSWPGLRPNTRSTASSRPSWRPVDLPWEPSSGNTRAGSWSWAPPMASATSTSPDSPARAPRHGVREPRPRRH
ncbi:2-succinyl-5-enolpyruvyl-6-hydroxy-3-cyclohexene-1-carboxylate synthase [Arthrobacter sp. Hiyo8]|nr:2-succinyl-5-enolpyruvyl-6-hydroxy-3-cyclohexene-1-carboxylate synthase [Arthrobacter sp. Hiyo8]